MTKFLEQTRRLVWGAPALLLILGVGLYLTVSLGAPQLRLFPRALRTFLGKFAGEPGNDEGVSSRQALCTALAATVGTGNLVGVAGAICLGGPGAVFWMWVSAFLGMATKFAETMLAVHFRVKTGSGFAGGPMYVITQGLGKSFRPLAQAYCLFGVIAAFGVGNAAQVNAVVTAIHAVLPLRKRADFWLGLGLALFVGSQLFGGAKRIAKASERLIPFAAVLYILMCAGALIIHGKAIPQAFHAIFTGAFHPKAVTGGLIGSSFQALRIGCSRGVFTNEAGMGTASIAHACAKVSHPGEQGLMGIMEVFLDTILICTLTALVLLCSGIPIPYGAEAGGALTTNAFSAVYGAAAGVLIALELILFAVATILGWGLYGAECARFLFGRSAWRWFSLAQVAAVVVAAVSDTALVWLLCDIVNALMAIPNLIALAALTPVLQRLTKEYLISGGASVGGGK